MAEHLSGESLSRLLDGTSGDVPAGEREHVEGCRTCQRELEQLRRMRMALSGMDELEPPPGEWRRVERGLRDAGVLPAGGASSGGGLEDGWPVGAGSWFTGWPARAAAAILTFGVGVAAGLQVEGSGGPAGRAADASSPPAALQGTADAGDELGALLAGGATERPVSAVEDPRAAAEELARLDALAAAVRERLRESPADPELNDLLFRIADRQESLTREFGQAAQLVSLDYR